MFALVEPVRSLVLVVSWRTCFALQIRDRGAFDGHFFVCSAEIKSAAIHLVLPIRPIKQRWVTIITHSVRRCCRHRQFILARLAVDYLGAFSISAACNRSQRFVLCIAALAVRSAHVWGGAGAFLCKEFVFTARQVCVARCMPVVVIGLVLPRRAIYAPLCFNVKVRACVAKNCCGGCRCFCDCGGGGGGGLD